MKSECQSVDVGCKPSLPKDQRSGPLAPRASPPLFKQRAAGIQSESKGSGLCGLNVLFAKVKGDLPVTGDRQAHSQAGRPQE